MKFNYIIASAVAALALITGCTKEMPGDLAEYQVSSSYVSIPQKGGQVKIDLNATVDWYIEIDSTTATWLKVSPANGAAGQFSIAFSADSTDATRTATLYVKNKVNSNKQYLNVTQQAGATEVKVSTCAEVIASGVKGKEYKVTGSVKQIVDAKTYGNWYIEDETGTLYIYGTKNAAGETKKGALVSYGVEVGDILTVTGPYDIYNGTHELVDVTIENIVKSLIKICSDAEVIAEAERDTVEVKLVYKGSHLDISTDSEWLSVLSTSTIQGEADTTVVSILAATNEGKGRSGLVYFASAKDGQETVVSVTVNQAGGNIDIQDVEVDKPAHVIGKVTAICKMGFILTDETASILYYDKTYSGGYTIGDEVEIQCSKVAAFNKGLELEKDNCTSVVKISEGSGTYSYPTPRAMAAGDIDAAVIRTENALAEYVSITGELSISGTGGKYCNIIVEGTANQGSIYQITDEMKATLTSGKKYTFTGYLTSVSSSKYANILITKADPVLTYNKVTAITSGKQYLMVFADTLALDNLAESKSYGYPTATACKAVSGVVTGAFPTCEYTFTAVAGGYNIIDSYGRFVYIYKDGAKSFNVKTEIPATPENCGVWTVSFGEGGIATVQNVFDSSWIQYNPTYTSAGSYKTAQSGAIMPVLYEKQ